MSRNLTADGRPVCGAGCRWPRGECPTHPMPSFQHRNVPYGGPAGVAVLQVSRAKHRELRPGVGRAAGDDATCGGCGYHVCACAAKAPARKPGELRVGDRVRCIHPLFPELHGRLFTITKVNHKEGADDAYEFGFGMASGGAPCNFFAKRFELVEPAPAPRATAG